jgi:hypothetical protein
MRLRRASAIVVLCVLASATTAFAADEWVLWRHYVPVNSPELDDSQMWRAQPGTKTQRQCETEMKEDMALDSGRAYRIEYRCLPDTVGPRGPKGKWCLSGGSRQRMPTRAVPSRVVELKRLDAAAAASPLPPRAHIIRLVWLY